MNSGPLQPPAATAHAASSPGNGLAAFFIAGVALLLYLPWVGIPHYGDDYLYLYADPAAAITKYFYTPYEYGGIFRPLQAAWSAWNQLCFGTDTHVLQGGQAALHALLGVLLFAFLRGERWSWWAATAAALLAVTNPATTAAVLGGDTFSQVLSTVAGCAAFMLAWRFGRMSCETRANARDPAAPPRASFLPALGCLLALAVAILAKETGLSFAGLVPLVLLVWAVRCWRSNRHGSVHLLILLAGCVLVTLAYFAYRRAVSPVHVDFGGTGGYSFRLGTNILVNQVLLHGATWLPWSTVDAYAALHARAWPTLAAIATLAGLWGLLVAYGLVRGRYLWLTLGLLVAAGCATVPVTLMNHVSELYAYNIVPVAAILLALGWSALLRWRSSRPVAVIALLIVLACNSLALQRKASLLAHNGRATVQLFAQLAPLAREVEPGGRIVLLEQPSPNPFYYSVFVTSDFQGLVSVEGWLRHVTRRPDISVTVVQAPPQNAGALILVRVNEPAGPRLAAWTPTSRP